MCASLRHALPGGRARHPDCHGLGLLPAKECSYLPPLHADGLSPDALAHTHGFGEGKGAVVWCFSLTCPVCLLSQFVLEQINGPYYIKNDVFRLLNAELTAEEILKASKSSNGGVSHSLLSARVLRPCLVFIV